MIICSGTDTNGVASDGGNDSVTVTSGALITLDASGIRNPQATAVDAGADQDNVLNLGAIIAQATAVLTPILTPPDPIPGAPLFWGALIQVGPQSTGIAGGAGNDTITNAGSISSSASATTLPAVVPAPVEGVSKADLSSTANAKSTAIDGGDNNDSITNTGSLTVNATASATGVSVSLAPIKENGKDGKSQLNGNVKANAGVTGLAGGAGDDTVTNLGAFDVTSSAMGLAAGGAGVEAKGSAAASAKSSSEADAMAIDLGGGNDTLANHAAITATAGSTAYSLDLAVGDKNDPTTKGKIQAAANGGAAAKSSAVGISADGTATTLELDPQFITNDTGTTLSISVTPQALATGDDSVFNNAGIGATANATALAAGVGVTINGSASAKVTSNAGAEAVAIDLGGGNDTLTNSGKLTATANSIAGSLDVTVGDKTDPATQGKIKSAAEGGTTAESTAAGITADGLGTDTEHTLALITTDTSTTVSYSQKTTHASGNDTVTNDAEVGASATATTLAAGIGVTINGKASAKVNSDATATAAAIDLGGGNDTLANTGKLTATTVSDASALNVAVGTASDSSTASSRKNGSNSESAADGGATAKSTAVGIAADGMAGDTTRGGNLAINDQGPLFGYSLALAYDQSTTHASGDDVVTNHGDIEAHASATARAAGVGVTVNGAASANSTSSTESTATAIDLGRGNDTLTNTGKLTVTADSSSQALKAAVSTKGRATSSDGLWHGGVKSEASATGIDAAGAPDASTAVKVSIDDTGINASYETKKGEITPDGRDQIINYGDIDAHATATSNAANVSVTSDGTAAAISHVEAKAGSAGIRAGNGADDIQNLGTGTTTVTAESHANAGQVAVSGKGAAVAADALWDSGTRAESTAVGIDADGGATDSDLWTVGIGGSGVKVVHETKTTSASGNDKVVNEQAINATAETTVPSIGVALEAKKGLAASISSVDAQAASTAIRGGSGDDDITNRGKLTATAGATAAAANVAIAKDGVAAASDSVWDGGTTATATAVGIDADGGDLSKTANTTLTVDGSGATIEHKTTTQAASGNDTVLNESDINATATALAGSASVGIVTKGLSVALSQSTAKSDATAIHGGDGNDTITNHGKLTANATSTAAALSVAVTLDKGAAFAGNAVWDGGVTADATAKGIDADGGDKTSTSVTTIKAGSGGGISRNTSSEVASGNDVITNSGEIDATANAIAPEVSAAIAITGVSGAVSTSTATSNATAIDAGAGNDQVSNTGKLNATASSVAVAVNGSVATKGVAISADGVWDGGTKANATAKGIDGGDGNDSIDNGADIEAHATAVAPSISGAVAVQGVAGAISAATATANATAIDGGSGNDTIHNTGKLTSTSAANADGVSVAVTTAGVALAGNSSWDGGVTAEATAKGIDAGSGLDTVLNEGEIDTHATAVSPDVAVSVAVSGAAGAVSTATAKAQAAGIDTSANFPDGADTITNKAKITTHADATAVAVNGSVTTAGVAISADGIWDGGTHADATATGIHAGVGADTIANDGEIDAGATAVAPSISGSLAVSGVAGAISAATATANATAIDANDGNDQLSNTAKLTASTVANANGVSLSVTTAGVAVAGNTAWDGGVTSVATSKGIDGGKGQDGITNSGEIDANATAVSTGANVSVAVSGVAGAISAAQAKAQATGIDGGDGGGMIANTGKITATTLANADALGAAVSVYGAGVAGNNTWDGGTTADARSAGINGGAGLDLIDNGGAIDTHATAVSPEASVGFSVFGVSGAVSTATAKSRAIGIDTGDGDDQVRNTAKLTSNADATAVAVNIGLTFGGVGVAADSVWNGGTTAEATAKGIDGGKGRDQISNAALIDITANSTTVSNSDTITAFGVAGATSTSNATANATAIDGGDDADVLTNSGELKATSNASATGVSVAITAIGASVATDSFWNGGTQANAASKGIAGGTGDDQITNTGGLITADAMSETHSVSVSATGAILAAASAASTSTANSTALDGGEGNDDITNDHALVSKAQSSASGVSVAVALAGGAVSGSPFDNATQANATATGIAGGAGNDTVHNTELSSITLDSHAIAKDTAVSVGVLGFSGTNSGSKATARATGIDGGDGNDLLDNQGAITGTVTAEGKARGISITAIGASIGDASTTADAGVTGIAGGAGDDSVTNGGAITLTPHAEATGQSISVGVAGVAIGDAGANATSSATGIDGGQGKNNIVNRGAITGTVTANGTARSVSVAAAGFTLSKADTTVTTDAAGIRGGDNSDNVRNEGAIDVNAASTATANSVSVAVGGASNASAQTLLGATAVGIDSGGGNDTISNAGDISINATSDSVATSSSWTVAGTSKSDSGTVATTAAAGLAGGDGNDFIENLANIGVHAGSTVSVSGGGFTFAGTGKSTAQLTATTNASGIAGDDGNDDIRNAGAITVDAASVLTSTGGKIVPLGQSDVGATIGATTTAVGIDGGAGDDAITNLNTIDVTAGSTVTQNSSTFTFGGVGATNGTLAATSSATGISGGDGADAIRSEDAVTVKATSTLSSTGGSVTPFGTSAATTTIGAETTATGIDGGAGDDAITSLNTLDVTASSSVTQNNSSFTFGGTGATGGALAATTHAIGISGGDGNDAIRSEKAITVNASSSLSSTGGSTTPFGTSQAGATIGADTTATGIDGGTGDDSVTNLEALSVTAGSTVTLGGTSFSLGGTGNAAGALEASSRATGIDGGAGRDQIQNLGTIDVTASSKLDSQSGSNVGFGTSNTGGSSGAMTDAVGIAGGGDDDFLNNLGTLEVTANSTVAMNGSTYTFGGTGSSAGTLAATTRASGMSGGDGADRLRNQGDITVQATSSLDTKGQSKATFGTASGGATSGAVTEATGLDGGAGDNVIENLLGTIDVNVLTTVTANKAAYTFGGTASTGAVLEGVARAGGISAGDGANSIRNDAAIIAAATSSVSATGGTKTTFGSTSSSGSATADASASGIATGAGADVMHNSGTITVNATSDGTTSNTADAGWIAGAADTVSNAKGTATGQGISAGDGNNALQNDGDISVTAKGTGYAFALADGANLSWSGDGHAEASSQAGATAAGILAGNGSNRIINNKAITVLARATTVKSLTTTSQICSETTQVKQECTTTTDPDTGETTTTCHDVLDSNGNPVLEVVKNCQNQEIILDTKPTYAAANGNGVSGDGNATSAGNSSAEAYGIKAGDGDNLIVNNQDISVTASPEAKAIVSVSGGPLQGNATGSADASASARAYGIWAGDGNNEITNNGTVTVTAAPKAQAGADIAAGKGICIHFLFWTWCIADGTGTGTATASFDSLAVGIRTGDGDNRVTNNGALTVRASPATDGATTSVTPGIDHPTLRTSVTSRAVGIQTGNGDNQIVNTVHGVIDVGATAAPASDCTPPCTTSTSAVGIQTGNGNNLVVNDGTITTSVPAGGGARADVAIRTGDGNDVVQLGNGSSTIGSIELNAGDDSLTFIGSAKVAGLNDAPGSVNGGAGTDSLYFNGAGGYTGSIQNFETAAKDGAGTFALASLPTMQQLKISQGTLQTNSAYAFAPAGSFEAWIYGGGDHGMLQVNNGAASLAGNLSVTKGRGAYINGATYDVVQATQGLTGAFSDVALPAPSPLLHFSYEQLPDAAQVEANVASFTTMASNSVGMAVARYLDALLPSATGDLSDVLGRIQSLSAPNLSAAYASLSPDTYNSSTQAAVGGIAANTGILRLRMQNMRLGETLGGTRSASFSDDSPVMLAYDGTPGRLGRLLEEGEEARHGRYGLWLNAFGQKGDQDSDNTHAGFNYNVAGTTLGFDHDVTNDVLLGVSLGYARTNLNLDRNLGDGDINATVFSVYGSYFTDKGYVEGALSYGDNRFANTRYISIAGANRTATSFHDGTLLSGTLAGGYYFKVSDWTWEPFASLQYSSLDEDSFDEAGAGAVSLHVDARDTQYLASDLGLRFRRSLERANGILVPELSLAWNHDFAVDDRLVTAAFTGAPNTAFSVQGQDIERNGARLGGGVTYVNRKGLTSSLYYGAELRNGYTAQVLTGEIRYEFK